VKHSLVAICNTTKPYLIAENVQYHINVHQHNPMKPSDCMSILKHNLKKLKTHLSTRAFQHLVFTPHFISFFY